MTLMEKEFSDDQGTLEVSSLNLPSHTRHCITVFARGEDEARQVLRHAAEVRRAAMINQLVFAGCPEGGKVLDPFMGSGTTALVAHRLRRNWIGIELSEEYAAMAAKRIDAEARQGRLFA